MPLQKLGFDPTQEGPLRGVRVLDFLAGGDGRAPAQGCQPVDSARRIEARRRPR
ncbi:MAG TPA: hypothetical protein VFV05_14345 [Methylomirabilota bacterium]|nr:hypothetical protein [Methylomirabilota bacterium]